ncbi:hypothetical protein D9M68_948170 [compost metagenome]
MLRERLRNRFLFCSVVLDQGASGVRSKFLEVSGTAYKHARYQEATHRKLDPSFKVAVIGHVDQVLKKPIFFGANLCRRRLRRCLFFAHCFSPIFRLLGVAS